MPTRILREGINDSERVNALSIHAELFYRKLMSLCDDFGRFEANPAVLLGKLYSLRPGFTVDDIEGYLRECSTGDDPLMVLYLVGRKRYLQINNFGQRERTSKFPAPHGPTLSATDCGEPPQDSAYAPPPPPPPPPPTPTPTPTPTRPRFAAEVQANSNGTVKPPNGTTTRRPNKAPPGRPPSYATALANGYVADLDEYKRRYQNT
jgi:hypothetical protein